MHQDDAQRFQNFIRTANDRELYRVNPRYLAQQLRWTEKQTLDVLAISTAEGIWQLEWDSHCAACGALVQQTGALADLHSHQHCPACGADGEINLDAEIVLRASLAEDVRKLDRKRRDSPDFRDQVDEHLGRVPSLRLINRPLFRQLLGEQVLPPNQSLGVQHVAVFFSDLQQSTRLYQHLGDAHAYKLVREHFEVIFDVVERHGGSAVKTIGDGVMGTFSDDAAALQGVIECITEMEKINQRENLAEEDCLRLKVGLHAGACIVVTLNGRLDYFGSTVNIAARLSDLAGGREVVLSQEMMINPAVNALVAKMRCKTEDKTRLRGVLSAVGICRLQLLDESGQ